MVMQKVSPASKKPQSNCKHHWHIEPADGLYSKGHCILCGAKQTFKNWVGELELWQGGEEKARERASRGGIATAIWRRQMLGFNLIAASYELNELREYSDV